MKVKAEAVKFIQKLLPAQASTVARLPAKVPGGSPIPPPTVILPFWLLKGTVISLPSTTSMGVGIPEKLIVVVVAVTTVKHSSAITVPFGRVTPAALGSFQVKVRLPAEGLPTEPLLKPLSNGEKFCAPV